MEYETKLFDTDEIMSVDIQMDEETWEEMLENAMSEEYYTCDVEINGQKFFNVAIRPKGNTSLSAIAMDPDTDRYSLKLEFGHYVEGQTCFGLDKLILNNNYADATNMKETIIYDMYQYLGAEASLYNYAKVSVNGEYRGLYLALEAVEESFMLRNFGTRDGELYKPESMGMGGGGNSSSGSSAGPGMPNMPDMDFSDVDFSQFEGMTPPTDGSGGGFPGGGFPGGGFPGGGFPGGEFSGEFPGDDSDSSDETDSSTADGTDGGGIQTGDTSGNPTGDTSGFPAGDISGFPAGDISGFPAESDNSSSGGSDSAFPGESGSGFSAGEENRPEMGNSGPPEGGGGGFSMSNGGANLNYSDDDLDSYSTIWEGSITSTGKQDHRRVVTALKNISEGNDLETYMDVDNILKYMAVHTFAVNMDSLSGSMAHNYYLYEYNGQLSMIPWDYNLSFGGMSMGSSGDATEMINDAIDTPFSGTKFFDALLADEEYLERYHAYLQQLCDEYVNGGQFDETYERIRSQIDSLVETDPTAFYNYEEYQNAVQMLYETIKLRAESIEGQLNGTIPSTDTGQKEDSSSLIDGSQIDVKAMGQFNMGGFSDDDTFRKKDKKKNRSWSKKESAAAAADTTEDLGQKEENSSDNSGETESSESGPVERPDFENENTPPSFPDMGGASTTHGKIKNVISYSICMAIMLGMLLAVTVLKRKRK